MSPASKLHAVIVDDESSYLYLLETILEEILTCPIKAYTHPEMALQELPDLEAVSYTHLTLPTNREV